MTTSETRADLSPSSYTLELPAGFVPLPHGEVTDELLDNCSSELADALFVANDAHCRTAVGALTELSSIAEELGVDKSAVGFFISPQTENPVMLFLAMTGFQLEPSDTDLVVAGLKESLRNENAGAPRDFKLPNGPAVLSVGEKPTWLSDGSTETPLLQRSITLWAPSPAADSVAVISIATNNWPEWEDVCYTALDVFRTLSWEA